MENNDKPSFVEMSDEPKVSARFGFAKEGQSLSQKTIKICALTTSSCLILIFLMGSPNKEIQERAGISSPDVAQINSNLNRETLDAYSASQENEHIRKKNKISRVALSLRLPGLQKIDPRRINQIPPGSMLKAVLITGASDGPVKAEVSEALIIQGETLIPAGTTLIGAGGSTEDRLMIRFNQVVFKDGSFESIQGYAADIDDKTIGLKGSKVSKYALKYATAIGLNFVGGMAEGLKEKEVVNQQVVNSPSAKNALLSGTNKATIEMASETMTDIRNSAPVIQIKSGQEILVFFESTK